MTRHELETRVRVLETAVDILVRLLTEQQRETWRNSLENRSEGDTGEKLIAHHWAESFGGGRATAGEAARALFDWHQELRAEFGDEA